MWNNLKVVSLGKKGLFRYFATLGNDQELEASKMEWNTARFGKYLKTNEEEEEKLSNIIDGELQRIIDKHIK
jgi:hypothetical protein